MSETTHIICAHCGKDHAVSNRKDLGTEILSISLFEIFPYIFLWFNCPDCKVKYALPVDLPLKE